MLGCAIATARLAIVSVGWAPLPICDSAATSSIRYSAPSAAARSGSAARPILSSSSSPRVSARRVGNRRREVGRRPVQAQRRLQGGERHLVAAQGALERVAAHAVDRLAAPDQQPRLRPAEQLVAAERHHVGAAADAVRHHRLARQSPPAQVDQRAAAEVLHHRQAVPPAQLHQRPQRHVGGEALDAVVRRVHLEQQRGLRPQRPLVVGGVGAVGGADLAHHARRSWPGSRGCGTSRRSRSARRATPRPRVPRPACRARAARRRRCCSPPWPPRRRSERAGAPRRGRRGRRDCRSPGRTRDCSPRRPHARPRGPRERERRGRGWCEERTPEALTTGRSDGARPRRQPVGRRPHQLLVRGGGVVPPVRQGGASLLQYVPQHLRDKVARVATGQPLGPRVAQEPVDGGQGPQGGRPRGHGTAMVARFEPRRKPADRERGVTGDPVTVPRLCPVVRAVGATAEGCRVAPGLRFARLEIDPQPRPSPSLC